MNKRKFKAKLVEQGKTISELANVLGVVPSTIYRKLDGISEFDRKEMQLISEWLSISDPIEFHDIFFTD